MKNDFNSTPPTSMMRLSSGRVEHQKVGGVLFMNITKPKPIPTDICNRCMEVLEDQLIEIFVKEKNCTHKEHLPVYRYEAHKLSLQHRYYVECAKLYEKGKRNG